MTPVRVLVVDDGSQIVRGLKIILRSAGYAGDALETRSEALAKVAARARDALVLDLALPDGQGMEVCEEVRRWSRLSILLLSGVAVEREKFSVLDAGADDYVTKPFGADELLARSAEARDSPTLDIGDLLVDHANRRVSRAGADVLLTPTERVRASIPGGWSHTGSCCARCGA